MAGACPFRSLNAAIRLKPNTLHRTSFALLIAFSLTRGFAQEPASASGKTYIANDEWRPIHWEPPRIAKGSALDFSPFLSAPAGKFGEAIIRDGQFVFQDAPDKPVRIYGVVISHALPYLDKPRCEQLADYLAASGYNGVRLHNYNFAKAVMTDIGSTEFTPTARDQLDYFFFCLKQRGIYYSFPINAWGFFKAGDVKDVPEFRDRAFRFESNGLLPISHDLQQWFEEYALNFLNHVNPYTGLALKDDPALLSIELTNEDSLLAVLGQYPEFVPIYRNKCREMMQAATGHEPTQAEVEKRLPGYVEELQEQFFQSMKGFLRQAGVRQPLTDLNFRDNMAYALPRSQLDYVDIHAYWALYQTLPGAKGPDAPYRQNWQNPNTIGWGYYLGPTAGRLFGKPYVTTEFNGCYPTPYWSFTGPVEAVLAGSQGWNGVYRCGLAAQPSSFFQATPVRQIGTGASPLMMFSERIGALLFAQGEVPPLPDALPLAVTPEYLRAKLDLAGGPKHPATYQQLAFQYQLGTVLLDGTEDLRNFSHVEVPPDMPLPDRLKEMTIWPADNHLPALAVQQKTTPAPFHMDTATGAAQISTPRSETFLLPAEVSQSTGKRVSISGNTTVSVCFAGSLDGSPLPECHRALVLYLTDLKNTGTEIEYEPKERVVVRNPGHLPLLVQQGRIEMAFQMKDRPLPHVWALKYDGTRGAELQPRRTPTGFALSLQAVTDPETFCAYELVWN
jgi:hypothetical protein